ncbi:hypothetical protein K469DRAFT_743364 [Zopfia rhizophila CBS 207.26]|uniref:DUF7924 domain-containing protein n=1 Tax=Zopfia rhizophila CBS 207.26 TaxID=1314779 RepID=A0A6A6D8F0_9PEZI|nr:hypothetical protein K469DRAFT_743364 [Zopfia rhizophila CBS 207.26]
MSLQARRGDRNGRASAKTPKRPREEDEVPPSSASPEPLLKRVQTSAASVDELVGWETISEARVDYWRKHGTWPTEEQEKEMDRFRDIVRHALARKRLSAFLRRKRLDASINAETLPPEDILFSDDLFEKTLDMLKGRNEARVIRDIVQLNNLIPIYGPHCSYFAATYDMYLPFLTCEIKCGAALFLLVGRENELHREISGFSISHSDECVRIWGHYTINGRYFTFFRHPIAKFDISKTVQGDNRWMAYNFIRNIYDLWLPEHLKRICSTIDMLPVDLNFEVSDQPEPQFPGQELASLHSGLSQRFEDYSLANNGVIPDSQPGVQQITPDTTIPSESIKSKRNKK